jgi:predicted acylesterase/phospholipase RssA
MKTEPTTAADAVTQAREHERERRFGDARRIVERARERWPEDRGLRHRLAVATYQDSDLHAGRRHGQALEILAEGGPVEQSQDAEALAIAGDVHRRRWEHDGRLDHLHRALFFYRRGAGLGVAADGGRTAVDAAFALDLLADVEKREDPDSPVPADRAEEARKWREAVVQALPDPDEWEPLLRLAEALIGLRRAGEAEPWLERAKPMLDEHGREVEAFARQVGAIVRLQEAASDIEAFAGSTPGQVLARFLGDRAAGAETAFLGKIGLALSGGGFRASLFHIGVLARLAELDALRRVEVLSCVSGGSILGAHYYLKVRKLLQEAPDSKLERDDYVTLVEELIVEFVAGVQQNVRVRLLSAPHRTLKMGISRTYSRTMRAGELYESCLYSRIEDGENKAPRHLTGLFIRPQGEPEDFRPSRDNWGRRAKVPILVINATTLNTGHNWQYTASWMGEPPAAIDEEIDSADRLRRFYYAQAPEDWQTTRLGYAVAASACVPGLFAPVRLAGLYPDMTLQLVDGGVHDNQGIASLIDQDCSVMLVSDASGQKETIEQMPGDPLAVLPRTNTVLMARVRQAEHLDLATRRAASVLRGLMFIHLRQGLDRHPRTWIGGDPETAAEGPETHSPTTSYGVRKDVQRALAEIRTDLDAFSDLEALALMNSGYRMTAETFGDCVQGLPDPVAHRWRFQDVDAAVAGGAGHDRLLHAVSAGREMFFKLSRLSPAARAAGALVTVLALAALVYAVWALSGESVDARVIVVAVAGLVALTALARKSAIVLQIMCAPLVLLGATVVWVGVLLHLRFVDRWYLRYGRVPPS